MISISAVLNPPADPALFFVADGSGGHAFAATYEQHQQNVARWRAIERPKAGLPPEAPVPATPGASAAPMTNPSDQPMSGAQAVITLPPGASQGAR